jgi:DNA-binding NarL/FixJ family response regulator
MLFAGRTGRGNSIFVGPVQYLEYDDGDDDEAARAPNAIGVMDMGYWLVDEMSAIADTLAEREAVKIATVNKHSAHVGAELSPRQIEVLTHIADGRTLPGAASAMGVSVETVKTNLTNIRWKLQAKNTTHAVAIAWRSGVIQ